MVNEGGRDAGRRARKEVGVGSGGGSGCGGGGDGSVGKRWDSGNRKRRVKEINAGMNENRVREKEREGRN